MEKVVYSYTPAAHAPTGQPAVDIEAEYPNSLPEEDKPDQLTPEQLDKALPVPCGYKILIRMPDAETTFKGTSLIKAESTRAAETVTSVVALVVSVGPAAYPASKFPEGPWCKVGDYILLRPYQGTRFICDGREYRIIFDDMVDGVVADPSSYRRV